MSSTPKKEESIWEDPYTAETYLSPDVLNQLQKTNKATLSAEQEEARLIQEGYIEQSKLANKLNLGRSLAGWTRNTQKYSDERLKTLGLRSDEICWKHPSVETVVLLHPKYAASVEQAENKKNELIKKGYVLQSTVAAGQIPGIPASIGFYQKTKTIEPDKEYLKTGTLPTGKPEEETIKGSELRWKHPFNIHIVLLHPDYVKAIAESNNEKSRLLALGYKPQAEVAETLDIHPHYLANRTAKIIPDADYQPNGLPKVEGATKVTVKGRELRWTNPYNDTDILLAPNYVKAMSESEKEMKTLLKAGYINQTEAAEKTYLGVSTLQARARSIISDQKYLPNGLLPTSKKYEPVVLGKKLRWEHPYNQNIILLSPAYVSAIAEAESKKRDLLEKGYVLQSDLIQKHDIRSSGFSVLTSSILQEGSYTAPESGSTLEGKDLIWKDPYSYKGILLRPDLAEALVKRFTKKAAREVSKGAASESVGDINTPSDELQEKLSAIEPPHVKQVRA